jgi:prepilin signal peptidase PulO-like enzyme (type II secretory pathway)
MNIFIILNVLFYICLSIVLFDLDYKKSKQPDEPEIPRVVNIVYLILIGSFLAILFLNWRFSVIGIIVYYASGFVPLPQIIGNFILSPFKPKSKK